MVKVTPGRNLQLLTPVHRSLSREAVLSLIMSREILSEMSSNITLFAYMLYDKNGSKNSYIGKGGNPPSPYMFDSFCKN